jgi:beta-lactamase class A
MCSTFKTYAASRVLQKSAAGELKLNDAVSISPEDIVANSPVTGAHVDQNMTIGELCQAALQQSDNAAGNWLLRIIGGPSRITDFARSIGDERTRLERWETELNTAIPGDPRDTSTPRALGEGYRKLLTGDALGAVERKQLEDWMRGNATSSMRAGLLPRWTSADKTGSGDYGSTNDVGVAYSPNGQRALLSFMTRSQTDDPKAQGLRPLIGELTTLVLPYLTGQM